MQKLKKVVDKSKEKFDVVDRANKRGRTTKDITIGGQNERTGIINDISVEGISLILVSTNNDLSQIL